MDFAALPPEINSGRMYIGPGSGPMLAAAASWGGLAAEVSSAASDYGSVIAGLTSGPWKGAASASMAGAAAPYVSWMSATATQAEQAAAQARRGGRLRNCVCVGGAAADAVGEAAGGGGAGAGAAGGVGRPLGGPG